MLLGDASSAHVVVTAEPEAYRGGTKGPEVWVTLKAHAQEFTAALASCIARSDWQSFLAALTRLEASRRGEAVLQSAVPDELWLRVYASDPAGHMAVDVKLHQGDALGTPLLRLTAIGFDPSRLPLLLEELRSAAPAV
jgi:hypothetical protein